MINGFDAQNKKIQNLLSADKKLHFFMYSVMYILYNKIQKIVYRNFLAHACYTKCNKYLITCYKKIIHCFLLSTQCNNTIVLVMIYRM